MEWFSVNQKQLATNERDREKKSVQINGTSTTNEVCDVSDTSDSVVSERIYFNVIFVIKTFSWLKHIIFYYINEIGDIKLVLL